VQTMVLFHNLKLQEAIQNICLGKVGWNSPLFDSYLEIEKLEILNLTRPVEVEEGVYSCHKCKGTRTSSVSRQTRSSDEPATVFITCQNTDCGHRWRIG
jgi:hypothetical protein